MRTAALASLVAMAAVAAPAAARADVLLTPYGGVNFSGSTVDHRAVVGGSVTLLASSGLGLEVDLGFIPDFFVPRDLARGLGTNNVTTVMGNLVFARRRGGLQPYLAGGAGLIRTQLGDFGELFDAAASNLGVNVGGGLRLGGGRVSIQGDVRYFRNLTNTDEPLLEETLGDFSFWRGTVGITFGF